MGKNLKGKECGAGICQRKDRKYAARFLAKDGTRRGKHFNTLQEARNWLSDARYEDKHGIIPADSEMTVNDWFEYWMKHLICDLSPNTRRNYQERYKINIQPVIGNMKMTDVKPMHCLVRVSNVQTASQASLCAAGHLIPIIIKIGAELVRNSKR